MEVISGIPKDQVAVSVNQTSNALATGPFARATTPVMIHTNRVGLLPLFEHGKCA
jgi:hypothetical protein